MTILFITNHLPPIVDGVGDYTYNIAMEFARHGHKVHVLCRSCKEIHTDYKEIIVNPIIEYWNKTAGKQIAAYVRQHHVDVVSLQYVPHGFHPKGLPFGLVAALKEVKKTGIKVMTFCHEVSIEYKHGTIRQRMLEMLMKYVTKSILRLSDYTGTSIVYYRDMMLQLTNPHRSIAVIPIASNIPVTEHTHEELAELRNVIASKGEHIVAFFGMRDTATSLAAIEKLQDEGQKVKILFIGKIPTRMVDKLPADSYKTGILDSKDIYQYFLVADILILPENNISGCSFKSGSLAAAMRAGLPVVTAKGYLTDSSLVDKENIVFTDFSSDENIISVLKSLLGNKDECLRIGANARQLVATRTWEYTYCEYMKVLS
ncbi:MAG: glycosyltransferase family 4 protein [Prevotella sp.]